MGQPGRADGLVLRVSGERLTGSALGQGANADANAVGDRLSGVKNDPLAGSQPAAHLGGFAVRRSSQDLAPALTAVADRISVQEGTLLSADPGQREWLVRMINGVARIQSGGVLEMNTASAGPIDTYVETFTVSVDPS